MTRQNIDFGIDLGTTNSAVAVSQNGATEVIRNNDNTEFTPSAVRISPKGAVSVGRGAKDRVEDDPDNAAAEFKRSMGIRDTERSFDASGEVKTPTELSAEVLKSLKSDVHTRLGEDLDAAVITIPAAFEVHQTEATRQAARLAGIDASYLLQEPTAAAFAYLRRPDTTTDRALWLVYDFGGGTFDAAVMRLRDGECKLIAHQGDNHLGGSRIDWDLVDQVLIPAAHRELGWTDLARGRDADPRWRATVAKLKGAAETAKITLSGKDTAEVEVTLRRPDGTPGDLEVAVSRSELERIATPYYVRSVQLCRKALAEAEISAHDVERLLLVGGSTIAPAVGALLADPTEGLGLAIDRREDPVTVVARGAAVFAAGKLRAATSAPVARPGEVACALKFNPVSDDPQPIVGGTLTGPVTDWTGYTVQFTNPDPAREWRGPQERVKAGGGFVAELFAREGTSRYAITLRDPQGRPVPITPAELTYQLDKTGIDDKAVLPQSIGVGLAGGEMLWFFESGTNIESGANKVERLRTTTDITRGGSGNAIEIPVLQGADSNSERNRAVGALEIGATQVNRDVPAGSEVEVTVEITVSQVLRVSAYVPLLGQDWESEIELGRTVSQGRNLSAAVRAVEQRVADLERRSETAVDPQPRALLDGIGTAARLDEIRRLLAVSDDKANADACESRLNELQIALDRVETAMAVPEQMTVLEDLRDSIQLNSPSAQVTARLDELWREIEQARSAGDLPALLGHEASLQRLLSQTFDEDPEFERKLFLSLCDARHESSSPAKTNALIVQGERAFAQRDIPTLRGINREMIALMPNIGGTRSPGPAPVPDSDKRLRK